MPDITISTEPKQEEKKQVSTNQVAEAITTAMEIEQIRKETEELKKAMQEQEEVRAKLMLGGRAQAGQYTPEKTAKEKADEEAAKILKPFL